MRHRFLIHLVLQLSTAIIAFTAKASTLESWDGSRYKLETTPCEGAIARPLMRRDLHRLTSPYLDQGFFIFRGIGSGPTLAVIDAVTVIAVDHDSTLDVAPDPLGHMHAVGLLSPPLRAQGRDGSDLLPLVSKNDGDAWEGVARQRSEQDPTDGMELEFTRPARVIHPRLVIRSSLTPWAKEMLRSVVQGRGYERDQWLKLVQTDTTEAKRVRTIVHGDSVLRASVWTVGGWEEQGSVTENTPGTMTIPLDLSRSFGWTIRVRLEETPGFWRIDQVVLDSSPDPDLLVQEVRPERAWSARHRDVRGPLIMEDWEVFGVAPGDTVQLAFRAPPPSTGQACTYFLQTTGWERLLESAATQPDPSAAMALSGPGAFARWSVERRNAVLASGHPAASAHPPTTR